MEDGEGNTTNGENHTKQGDDTAFCTEKECLKDAEAFNTMMAECGAATDNEEYFDDTSFDTQLDNLDWESGQDPFDNREWQIIRNNLEP